MNPQHHPAEEVLLRYASGEATEPFALLVASHIDSCAACRAAVAQAESIGGALLDSLPGERADPAAVEQDVAAILERAARRGVETPRHPAPAAKSQLASPLRPYIRDLESVPWRSLGPGIQQHVLAKDRHGGVARLLRIEAGRSVFAHSHRGNEMTLVLQGSYRAGDDRFQAGDVESADETVTHQPVAEAGATCICLAVTDAPLRFDNLLGRVMQLFIRI